jgi:DNA-binding SARP family transcriptional activator
VYEEAVKSRSPAGQLAVCELMLRLRTFGGLTLARGDDPPLTGAATQRRRLAILALLAVAGDRGLSRDKLLGCLWPESEFERARHTLNQLLYAQRKLFAGEALFAGRKSLRLNRAVVWTDVGAFEDALERGDLEAAAGLYKGPFLDGFFMAGALEFERWADEHRRRLEQRCLSALDALARRAAAAGDARAAAAWLTRAFDLDPLDSTVAGNLVRALVESGDRPGALRLAQLHARRLQEELELEPGSELQQQIERLRSGSGDGSV